VSDGLDDVSNTGRWPGADGSPKKVGLAGNRTHVARLEPCEAVPVVTRRDSNARHLNAHELAHEFMERESY
jgi:hypothetical protein